MTADYAKRPLGAERPRLALKCSQGQRARCWRDIEETRAQAMCAILAGDVGN